MDRRHWIEIIAHAKIHNSEKEDKSRSRYLLLRERGAIAHAG